MNPYRNDEDLKRSVIAYIRKSRMAYPDTVYHQEEDVELIGGELVRLAIQGNSAGSGYLHCFVFNGFLQQIYCWQGLDCISNSG